MAARARFLIPAIVAAMALPIAGRPRAAPASVPQDVPVKTLVARTSAYVADYQERFSFLIADELYVQQAIAPDRTKTDRVMRGELFLTYLPIERVWTAMHDIAEVDGVPVANRDDLRLLLQRGNTQAIGRDLAARNEQFNIGAVRRNFNEPTFALIVMNARRVSGFTFRRGPVTTDPSGVTIVSLEFSERDDSTIVRNTDGRRIATRGTLTIEALTGRVRQTFVALKDRETVAELSTTYTPDEKMGLWVPSAFTERYAVRDKGGLATVVCESKYTNYRRFEVTGRIK